MFHSKDHKDIAALQKEISRLDSELKDKTEEVKIQKLQNQLLKDQNRALNEQLENANTKNSDEIEIVHKPTKKKLTDSTSKTASSNNKGELEALQKKYDELRQIVLMHEESIKMKEMEAIQGDEKLLSMQKTIDSLREENLKTHKELERLKKENVKIQNEWNTLNTAKTEAESKYTAKVNEMAILQQDRQVLRQELDKFKDDNSMLKEQLSQFEHIVEKLGKELEKTTTKLSSLQEISTKVRVSSEDKEFQKRYNLPDTEHPITYYVCSNSDLQGGYLYITPQFLVFDTVIHVFWKSADSVKQTIPILLIESLNKFKYLSLLPGKGGDLEIKTKTGEVYLFRSFVHRKEAVKSILAQAATLNHSITTKRDGVVDSVPTVE